MSALLLLLLGCGGKGAPCHLPPVFADADGDGFGDASRPFDGCDGATDAVSDASDCDDADATAHPGAAEACDGVDHDCDGRVNEPDATDAGTWYADYDNDGFGDPAAAVTACTAPPAHVSDATDCGPTDPLVNPEGTERCDDADIDEDCDGLADSADPGAEGATIGYLDEDGDGWGSTTRAASCEPEAQIVDQTGDCDDGDATTFPGAPRVCGDGADHDCDGFADDEDADGDGFVACEDCDDTDPLATPDGVEVCDGHDNDCDGVVDGPLSVDAVAAAPDADGDGFGDASRRVWTCEVPEGWLDDASDCHDGDATVHPDAQETCATPTDDDCDGSANEVGAPSCDDFYQDADGDGFGEVGSRCQCAADATYSAPWAGDCDGADPAVFPGAPEVCLDGVDQDCDGYDLCDPEGLAVVAYGPPDTESYASWAEAGVDVTDDGVADLLVGDADYSGLTGRVLVYPGPLATGPTLPTWTLSGSASTMSWGRHLNLADVDGDGVADVVGATEYTDWGATNTGGVFVFRGPITGDRDVTTADLIVIGPPDSAVGPNATVVDDVDGDGTPELATGSGWLGSYGMVALVPGDSTGLVDASTATHGITGMRGDSLFGTWVEDLDWNGDGVTDLAVGSAYLGTEGLVYLFAGPVVGLIDGGDADGQWAGGSSSRYFGDQVYAPGDMDGDGVADLAARASDMAALLTGVEARSYAMTDATATFGDVANTLAAPLAAGDFNADGARDLFLAANATDDHPDGVSTLFLGPHSGRYDVEDADWGSLGGYATLAAGPTGDLDGDGRDDALLGLADLTTHAGVGAMVLVAGAELP